MIVYADCSRVLPKNLSLSRVLCPRMAAANVGHPPPHSINLILAKLLLNASHKTKSLFLSFHSQYQNF